jgi:hypothetical protein
MMGSPYDISVLFQSKLTEAQATVMANHTQDLEAAEYYHKLWEDKFCKCMNAGSNLFPGMEDIETCSILITDTEDVFAAVQELPQPTMPIVDAAVESPIEAEEAEIPEVEGSRPPEPPLPDNFPGPKYIQVGVLGHGEFSMEEEDYLVKCVAEAYHRSHDQELGNLAYQYQVAGVAQPEDDNALKVAPLYRRAEYCDGEFMCRKFYSILVLFCPSCSSLLTLVQHYLPLGATNLESWCWHCTCCVSTD